MTFELGGQVISTDLGPEIVLLVVGLAVMYETLVRRHGVLMHPRPEDPPVTRRHRIAFYGALLTLWVASGSPLHDISEDYLFSAHMVQHLLQALVFPPLLLLGIPRWMGEVLLHQPTVRRVVRFACRPLVAGIGFNLWLVLTHWPLVIDTMLTNDLVHFVDHVALVTASVFMWMNILSPVPHIVPRISPLPRMAYLFLMTLVPTIPSAFLIFGESVLYSRYATFPRMWGLPAIEDMQIAGLIMKVGGGFFLWGVIAVMFFRWAAAEERADRLGDPKAPATPTDAPTPV